MDTSSRRRRCGHYFGFARGSARVDLEWIHSFTFFLTDHVVSYDPELDSDFDPSFGSGFDIDTGAGGDGAPIGRQRPERELRGIAPRHLSERGRRDTEYPRRDLPAATQFSYYLYIFRYSDLDFGEHPILCRRRKPAAGNENDTGNEVESETKTGKDLKLKSRTWSKIEIETKREIVRYRR
ncbi:hypothetical protein EVAR_24741_1 [Eumeta japonica]|uniref:Uncharacterized protein n=1 Tax=Eumeta variegata TaxID=151549 RepID=A0A4C1VC65_EUMVA|nr:hypothetical protein EVAR_24741_1 [Eumeta japonica]